MITWTKRNNGHVLNIKIDEDSILRTLEKRANDFRLAIEEDDGEGNDRDETSAFYRSEVGGYETYLLPDECLTDIEDMADCVRKICCESNTDVIFGLAVYKKNGTFKKSVRHIIRQERFGVFEEDSYGWRVNCLRIVPIDDYNAVIKYTDTVQHY